MNKVDEQYLSLLQDILENGVEKGTRSGKVRSVFGRQLRFDLKDGFPILTTKKVFTKGVIHELLWFLQRPRNSHGSMNIEYLIRNGVHIWDDDAYRWFKNQIVKDFNGRINDIVVCTVDDEINNFSSKAPYEYWIERDVKIHDPNWLPNITKEEFLDLTAQKVELRGSWMSRYRFGDLGPIYGKQWRHFGESEKDQIEEIINKLKTNPNDRRMLCVAYNPDELYAMALPPCHVMFQFYTRELSQEERINLYKKAYKKEIANTEELESTNIPKYGLSCMWTQRSVDVPLGLVWNIVSYGLLTHIIAKLANMIPDELIGSLGDCHIYLNQLDGVKEQLNRKGYDELPNLIIDGEQKYVEDFKFEDFKIMGYKCDPIIKMPLSVG